MKKIVVLFLTSIMVAFISCNKDDGKNEPIKVASIAKVKVTQNGKAKSGVTVCLFTDTNGPGTSFFKPFYSSKKVITETDGIAQFELKEVFDLETIDTQTTLYFGVFGTEDNVLGKTAMTIKKGETKMAEISLE